MQQIAVLFWLCSVVVTLRQHRNGKKQTLFVCMAQIPGMVAVLASVFSQLTGRLGEWGDGVLEVWVHPFMPYLEMLPPGTIWNWSDVYVVSCILPFAIITLCMGIKFVVLWTHQPRKNPST